MSPDYWSRDDVCEAEGRGSERAVQDYLRDIYKLQTDDGHVKTSALTQRMGVAPPSATAMMKKLASYGFVDHRLYRGVRLTRTGERIALELLRHHRLLKLYLAQTLDLGLDAVHAEADRLEHALSQTLEERIDKALGSPTQDPTAIRSRTRSSGSSNRNRSDSLNWSPGRKRRFYASLTVMAICCVTR